MTPTPDQAFPAIHPLLQALSQVQTAFLQGQPPPRLFEPLLAVMMEQAGSEFGFIAEVVRGPEGRPVLQPLALANLAWTPGMHEPSPGEAPHGVKSTALQSLSDAVLMTGQPVVSNHRLAEEPRSGGPKEPHPLRAFLGLPIRAGEELVGMVGLANRPGGYDTTFAPLLQPVLATCGTLLVGLRSEHRRHRAEEELRRSEAGFRTFLDQAPDAILIHREGLVVFANPSASALLGLAGVAELVGQPVAECAMPGHEEALTQPSPSRSSRELRLRHRQGRLAVGEVVTVPLVFQGAPALACIVRDISERRQVQERLVTTERLASLGTLTAGMAHEINNPLAYILSNLNYVNEELQTLIEEGEFHSGERAKDLLEALGETLSGSRRVRDIVRDLKLFARNAPDQHGLVNLPALLDSCVNMAWGDIKHRARVVKDYAPVPPLYGNESRLAQVFLHLLLNAVQALPPQGGDSAEIRLSTRHEEGLLMVSIHDTGAGIPEEDLERLFDPFFTTKPPRQGTGLGLSTCNRIVTELGGHITVESHPGRGSTFRVFLPTNARPTRTELQERPDPPVPRAATRAEVPQSDAEQIQGNAS
ncbi:ATP-binding protein [Hyalangium versicolor]|uniref:ATP-binding protein n=1 Tax=Hyalangium versicolor TaxID=2861190 RepID=UPI001CD01221|nr:ATP-binding protein [Hyalangium versicolor]